MYRVNPCLLLQETIIRGSGTHRNLKRCLDTGKSFPVIGSKTARSKTHVRVFVDTLSNTLYKSIKNFVIIKKKIPLRTSREDLVDVHRKIILVKQFLKLNLGTIEVLQQLYWIEEFRLFFVSESPTLRWQRSQVWSMPGLVTLEKSTDSKAEISANIV